MRKVYAGSVKPLANEDLEHILRVTGPVWEAARGCHIFISGGTGFFGAWLLESLVFCNRELDLGVSVTVLSRDPEGFARRMPHVGGERSIRLLKGDVRDLAFPLQEVDYIIHAAAPTTASAAERPDELLSIQVDGTERMIELAKATGARRFLYISSGAVYGRQAENVSHISEDDFAEPNALDPMDAYGEGKRASEQMCFSQARELDIEFAIARCFAFVGPHLPLDQHFAIGNFIGDALAGRNIAVHGDGTPLRSYLYGADLAIWLWTMLLAKSAPGVSLRVFNVGSGKAISIADLARVVVEELNPSLRIEMARQPVAGQMRHQYVPDVTRASTILDLRQTIGLREAIRRTAAWHRRQN